MTMNDRPNNGFRESLGPTRAKVADRLISVTCGITAISDEGKGTKLPGSGIFIAPFLGLTAKHVVVDMMNLHSSRPIYGKRIPVTIRLHQIPTIDHETFPPDEMPIWVVREVTECPYSDLALLDVFPENSAAKALAAAAWNDAIPKICLLPPSLEARVRILGYPGVSRQFDDVAKRLDVTSNVVLSEGRVTEVFADWRLPPRPSGPAILGPRTTPDQDLTDFPCFEVTAPIEQGMSGSGTVSGPELVGIVSSGLDLPADDSADAGRSRIASLWPLIFTRNISMGLGLASFLELLQSALLNCADWREVEKRAYLDESQGKPRARLRPA